MGSATAAAVREVSPEGLAWFASKRTGRTILFCVYRNQYGGTRVSFGVYLGTSDSSSEGPAFLLDDGTKDFDDANTFLVPLRQVLVLKDVRSSLLQFLFPRRACRRLNRLLGG